jgi:hypothetical protein
MNLIKSDLKNFPVHGWLGIGLIIGYWYVNWALSGLRTHIAFFPMWLGYCLAVDALVLRRKGSSMLTRYPVAYIKLFIISAPGWWLFELLNWRTQNWVYQGREFLTDFQYFVLASLSFSTVMPAVFGTAELVSTFDWLRRMKPGWTIPQTRAIMLGFFVAGWVMLALLLLWPLYCFPFVWGSVFCILEPLNVWLTHRSLTRYIADSEWRPIVSLAVGCLICGFFWEMWNFYAYPKWIYHVPFVGFLKVFEMPLLGYLGYIPFSFELFALYHLVTGIFKQKEQQDFIQVILV